MASGKGSTAQGSKKRSARRGKPRSAKPIHDTHTTADTSAEDGPAPVSPAEAEVEVAVPVADNFSDTREKLVALNIGEKPNSSKKPNSGSSGKQAQMVFTVGTFDDREYDGRADSDGLSDGTNVVLQSRFRGSRQSADIASNSKGLSATETSAAVATNCSAGASVPDASSGHTPPTGDASRNVHPADMQNGRALKESAASLRKSQPNRQPLFTMGSHSELSDLECADEYDAPADGRRNPPAEHVAGSTLGDNTRDNLSPSANLQPRIRSRNSRVSYADAVMENGDRSNHANGSVANSGDRAVSSSINSSSGYGPNFPVNEQNRACSPAALHACKAMTSLMHLADPSASHRFSAQSANAADEDGEASGLALRERVISAPTIQESSSNLPTSDNDPGIQAGKNREASETLHLDRGRAPLLWDTQLKARKKTSARKPHVKKAVSSAALRTRLRHGTTARRDNLPSKGHAHAGVNGDADVLDGDGHVEGSYVDYSGNSDSEDGSALQQNHPQQQNQQQQQQNRAQADAMSRITHANISALDQSRGSLHSSTATLGGACQDIDDSVTTASMDSPCPEQADARDRPAPAGAAPAPAPDVAAIAGPVPAAAAASSGAHNGDTNGVIRYEDTVGHSVGGAMRRSTRLQELRSHSPQQHQHQQHQYAHSELPVSSHGQIVATEQSHTMQEQEIEGRYADTDGQLNGGRDNQHQNQNQNQQQPGRQTDNFKSNSRQMSEEYTSPFSYGTAAHLTMSTNRNMESQRQQGIVEREREEMEIASSQLTGVPRRVNRPTSMLPHIFINTGTEAHAQQVRKTERVYAHVRNVAHPLLESISRCVMLREYRLAIGVPRTQPRSWASRRTPTEPTEADIQAEWWESLMPPPLTQPGAGRDQRMGAESSARQQPTELPHWMLVPDEAKCAVYGPDLSASGASFGCYDLAEPGCEHIRELRVRAKELRLNRQQIISAGRNQNLPSFRPPTHQSTATTAAQETWRGRRVPGLLTVDMYPGTTRPMDLAARQVQRHNSEPPVSSSPDSIKVGRANPLAQPYRRYGTVYGCPTGAHAGVTTGAHGAAGGPGSFSAGNMVAAAGLAVRGQDGMPVARANSGGIWDNDMRRSSYFDRLSIDETRSQLSTSAAQTTTGGFLRRVISGLAGGTAAAFGASQ
ncbi:hypothetical protein LPJ66_004411 [Kickxella alabastrina]|uniref:Uncharacterized protein n=1 Tax=Kickxella alabastrina TaxID=61397 RepID=A0ACC1ILB6_9FUNG|nr:hypothetical protein LPJ66_004411 [Kickxella alabastrina]